MDSVLPPAPQQPAAGAYAIPPQQVQPQQQLPPGSQPRGRPPADPEVAEAKAQRHQERRRVESVMPKKALDSKILIYRTRRGRPVPGQKPVCTVLITDLEEATRDGAMESEDFLRNKLAEKIGDRDPSGTFQCVTVDRRGARINEVPPFDISLVDDGGEEDDESDDPQEDDGRDGFDPGEPGDYDFRGDHPVEPPVQQQQAPPPTKVDYAVVDDIGRRNREEEKSKSSENTALLLGMFQSMAQQQAAAQQQQTQLFLSVMQANQQKAAEGGGTMVALVTALAPVLAKLLEPKPADNSTRDMMLPILLEMIREKRADPAGEMLKTIPGILSEVSKTQINLQSLGAEAAVKTSAQVNSMLMTQMMAMAKDVAATAKPQEKDDSGMGSIAQIAAAVLPALMGNKQPQQEPGFDGQQPQPALPAPAEVPVAVEAEPAPAPRRRTAKAPAPAAAAAEPQPQVRPPPTEDQRIRGCLQTVRKLEDGAIAADKRWAALQWILERAPERVLVEIRKQSTDGVMKECASAVLPDAALLGWISNSEHVDFLTACLDDVRLLELKQVTDEHAAAQVAALRLHQDKVKTERAAAAAAKQAAENGQAAPAAATAPVVVAPAAAEPAPASGKQPPPPVAAEATVAAAAAAAQE